MPEKTVDLFDFAKRVERLCDFLLDKIEVKDGSQDVVAIQKIKEDAANIQISKVYSIDGIWRYIHGG